MIRLLPTKRFSPIGVDLGTRSVKLVQLSSDRSRLVESVRWELPLNDEEREPTADELADAIKHARDGHRFRGHDAVLCLSDRQLFLQNVRVPKTDAVDLNRLVAQEAAGRLPFAVNEAEIRCLEAADVRQGDHVLREVIFMACQKKRLEETLSIVERAGLRPVAVDVEPAALVRSYERQFRRDEDRDQRAVLVHAGYSRTVVVIAQGDKVLFVKYIHVGGRMMDEAVARHLGMTLPKATALRRHNGDRRADQQDPDIAASVSEAARPVIEQLCIELSKCIRYHSVTFRGKPLARLVLGGGEATRPMLEAIAARTNLKCELTDALRTLSSPKRDSHPGQWDVALGLALREIE